MTRRILALLGIGLLGGFLSGTFGIGGGILMVPLFVLLLRLDQRRASALSLAAVLPAAIVGSITYAIEGHVDLLAAALVAVRMLIDVPEGEASITFGVWSVLGLIGLGLVVGIASGLFGIGGGVLIVPALVGLFGVTELIAKGTSLLAMVPTSITGTVQNTRAKLVRPVDGLLVGAAAALAAFPGALVAHILPTRLSHLLFAGLVLIAAVQLAIKAWRARRSN